MKNKVITMTLAGVACFALTACGGGSTPSTTGQAQSTTPTPTPTPAPPVAPPPPASIAAPLPPETFMQSTVPEAVDLSMMAPREDSLPARSDLDARLTFTGTEFTTFITERNDDAYKRRIFPRFSISLVTDGDDLIPLERNTIITWQNSNSFWDVVVGAGKIWREPGEDAWDRASVPVSLVSRRVGQAKNCVLQFLFTPTDISDAYVQCSQETSPIDFFQTGNMQVMVPVERSDIEGLNKEVEVATFRAERSDDLETRPWADLGPNADSALQSFNSEVIQPADMSFGALVVDDIFYMQSPMTRNGVYPYPRDMRHGVYSVTKTIGAGLATLYLAQRYGDDAVFDALITDYVPRLAQIADWQGVTVEHTLNMASGTGGADFVGELIDPFINARNVEEGLEAIAQLPADPAAPGTEFSYASTKTFVVSAALQGIVEAREGAGVYFWDLVQENVLDHIGVHHFPIQRTLEADGSDGIPTLGWGAFPTAHGAAKMAILLRDAGAYNGQQLLHRQRTLEATGETDWPGYSVSPGLNYRHSFWADSTSFNGCLFDVHTMQGHGANYVAILPSDVIVIRFMDQNRYVLGPLVRAAETIRSSCGP